MDIFIFMELRKGELPPAAPLHLGSTPKGSVGPDLYRPIVVADLQPRGGQEQENINSTVPVLY